MMNDRRSKRPSGDNASTPSEAWLFAQELLGRPVPTQPQARAETTAAREVREFVEAITDHSRSRPPVMPALVSKPIHVPSRPTETSSQRELREWVESISNAAESGSWDSSKHPRGGFPENPGRFSPSGGSAGGGQVTKGVERLGLTSDGHTASDSRGGTLLAQKIIRRPNVPQSEPQQTPPVEQRPPVFSNKFGTFPDRKDNPPKGDWRVGGPQHELAKPLSDQLRKHTSENIPKGIWKPLADRGLQVVVTPKLSDVGRSGESNRIGGKYVPSEGTIFVPQTLNDGTANPNPERDLRHEFGHAFDHATNGSTSREFLDAYEQDLKDQAPVRDLEMNHYIPAQGQIPRATFDQLQNVTPEQKAAGAREAFAEAFAEATQPTENGEPTEKNYRAIAFRRTFPNTIRYMQKRVKEYQQ